MSKVNCRKTEDTETWPQKAVKAVSNAANPISVTEAAEKFEVDK